MVTQKLAWTKELRNLYSKYEKEIRVRQMRLGGTTLSNLIAAKEAGEIPWQEKLEDQEKQEL